MMKEEKLYTKELYDLSHTAAAPLLEGFDGPFEALPAGQLQVPADVPVPASKL